MNSNSDSTPSRPRRYLATVPDQEILPIVDDRFESSVKGIHVVGDATGFPLVKVAANQGKQLIQSLAESGFKPGATDGALDLVIIGAGPAGISAALEAQKMGWRYVVLERNKAANTVRNFPPGKKVYAEPLSILNSSELDVDHDLEKEYFLQMIAEKIESHQLKLKESTEVTQVRQVDEQLFSVDTKQGANFQCRKVVVAIGRQGSPRLLKVPGADKSHKVTYRFHTVEDYVGKKVLVVGGGNSAIEAALLLRNSNSVTLSYRGSEFYRAKEENRRQLQRAIENGEIEVILNSDLHEIGETEVLLKVDGEVRTIDNDHVVIQIGTLPPIDFLLDMGLELDGIWNRKRFIWCAVGLTLGILLYFFVPYFSLTPDGTGPGRWLVPALNSFDEPGVVARNLSKRFLVPVHSAILYFLPIPLLLLGSVVTLNRTLTLRGKPRLIRIPGAGWILGVGFLVYYINLMAPHTFTLDPSRAGPGPYYLPGLSWIFYVIPGYFTGAARFYYLLYFSAILFFGLYWAIKINHRTLWIRNLTIIGVQWTLWWGIPTFLVVFLGTNPWTPLLSRSINAWPLKMDAFDVDPSIVRPGDPAWWYIVGVVGVVWAVFLTFVVIPVFTIRFGKIYCSYVCSCGALAETVGNGFRHRGPKGDASRQLEKYGYVFIAAASIATVASLLGYSGFVDLYNVWVGTFLAGALAIGLYPFLGQRIWCRMWCPLAFWMNFWGRWSKFKISPEKGKCIDCNVCNQYCQMGIDIKSRALQGVPVTLVDTPCVGCAECVMRCPMEILHIGEVPPQKLHRIGSAGNIASESLDNGTHQTGS